ncbi:hypothetical protein Mal15_51150 [Stieleria maiorica]|uniref:Uncharacterized protein n=1 Tax=Stieleria maiorica TaxID=2795974 RepID=A0A5B9MIL1_9BACT|nr:hypothetical protein Mal15_51150 [Stieleria maiorica]
MPANSSDTNLFTARQRRINRHPWYLRWLNHPTYNIVARLRSHPVFDPRNTSWLRTLSRQRQWVYFDRLTLRFVALECLNANDPRLCVEPIRDAV